MARRQSQFAPGHKETIFNGFRRELYGVPLDVLKREKDALLLQNMNKQHVLMLENIQTYFNGAWHVLSTNDPRGKVVRLELDSEFHVEMKEIQDEWLTLESEELDIIAYLKRILNRAMTLSDLHRLTPQCLHFKLPRDVISKFSGHGHQMISEEDILTFQRVNQDAEDLVKQRMLTNLLLPRE